MPCLLASAASLTAVRFRRACSFYGCTMFVRYIFPYILCMCSMACLSAHVVSRASSDAARAKRSRPCKPHLRLRAHAFGPCFVYIRFLHCRFFHRCCFLRPSCFCCVRKAGVHAAQPDWRSHPDRVCRGNRAWYEHNHVFACVRLQFKFASI